MCDGPTCCPPPAGRLQGIIRPWLLLLLLENDAHGYELLEKLKRNENISGIDPGFLYRTLRQFEQGGIVRSRWDEEGQGPARRVYTITDEGSFVSPRVGRACADDQGAPRKVPCSVRNLFSLRRRERMSVTVIILTLSLSSVSLPAA